MATPTIAIRADASLQAPEDTPARLSRPAPSGKSCVLFVVNDTRFFVSHRLPIAVAARAQGYDVHLTAFDNGDLGRVRAEGIGFHPLQVDRTGTNPLRDAELFLQIARYVRLLRPRLMHCVTIKPVVYGGLAARLLGVPALVSAVCGLGSVFADDPRTVSLVQRLAVGLYRRALRHRNSRVIFQNPDDREQFLAAGLVAPGQDVVIRGSGVDMDEFRPTPEPDGVPVVVLPARLLWQKGIGEFVEAARLIRSRGTPARLALVGEPPAHNRSSVPVDVLRQWEAAGLIEWWGFRKDMPELYRNVHIVCLPSFYREGIPKALIEAAACGRPIVTTSMPGCREVVQDGQNGLLVPPHDARALADALLALLQNPQQRIAMGVAGREMALREFSLQQVVRQTMMVYEQLAPTGSATRLRPCPT